MSQEPAGQEQEYEASVNQRKHEPTPASHQADPGQGTQAAYDEHANDERGQARNGGPTVHGDAVRDMMGGPPPQGDVPDAPATQIAAADKHEGGDKDEQGHKVRHVANAVPGKPDGEVDTRS
jgi:hypothetical protein